MMVTALAPHYDRIKRSPSVQVMVRGILAAFTGMLLFIAYRFGQETLVGWKTWALMAAAWTAVWRRVNLLAVIGAGAVPSAFLF